MSFSSIILIDNTYSTPTSYKIQGFDVFFTVLKFKQYVQSQKSNLLSELLNLTFNEQPMLNDKTLASYGIQPNGSTIKNVSSIIFLKTEIDNKTYNITSPDLRGTVLSLKTKVTLNYSISSLTLKNLYFGTILLSNSDIISSKGIGYGATLVAKPATTSGGDGTINPIIEGEPNPLPNPNIPGVETLLPNEVFLSQSIVNRLVTNIINTSQVINYELNLGSSNKSYFELISYTPNLNIVIEYYGYTTSGTVVNQVLISSTKISAMRVSGTTTVCYSYKNSSINPNNLPVPPSTYAEKINYKITNNDPKNSSFQFKCLIGFIINTSTLA